MWIPITIYKSATGFVRWPRIKTFRPPNLEGGTFLPVHILELGRPLLLEDGGQGLQGPHLKSADCAGTLA